MQVVEKQPGIYYIEGTDIKTQLLVTEKLLDEEAEYLKLLQIEYESKDLINRWLAEYIRNIKDPLYGVIMDVIEKNNPNLVMEVYKEMSFAKLSEDNKAFLLDAIKKLELDKNIMEEGEKKGKIGDILDILNDLGVVPKDLKNLIASEKDIEVLKRWVKIAARSNSIEEFREKIN